MQLCFPAGYLPRGPDLCTRRVSTLNLPDLKSSCSLLGACVVTGRLEPLEFLLRVIIAQDEPLRLLLPTPSKRWDLDEVIEYKSFKGPLLHFVVTQACLRRKTFDMVTALLQHGADRSIRNSDGKTTRQVRT
jgi:hypothetical protein